MLNNLILTKFIFLEAIGKKLSPKCSHNIFGALVMCAILTIIAVLIQNTATLVKFLGVTVFPIVSVSDSLVLFSISNHFLHSRPF